MIHQGATISIENTDEIMISFMMISTYLTSKRISWPGGELVTTLLPANKLPLKHRLTKSLEMGDFKMWIIFLDT